MTSKPATQKRTAKPRRTGGRAKAPVTATHAPTGAMASARPRKRCANGGDALGVRVAEDDREGDGREDEAEAVQLRGGEDEEGGRAGAEEGGGGGRDDPGRDLAARGARVPRVDPPVDDPVERHRRRPGAHHRDEDPEEGPPVRDPARREDRRQERERQREDGVGEDDEGEEVPRGRHRRASLREAPPGVKSCIVSQYTISRSVGRKRGGRLHRPAQPPRAEE